MPHGVSIEFPAHDLDRISGARRRPIVTSKPSIAPLNATKADDALKKK
jgi:hypothetical protein